MSDILAESLERLIDLAEAKANAEDQIYEHALAGDPTRYVLQYGDTIEIRDKPRGGRAALAPLRNHFAHDLDTLLALAGQASKEGKTPVIWVDAGKITLVWDDAWREEFCTLAPSFTNEFEAIRGLVNKRLTQRDLIAALRTRLADAVQNLDQVLPAVRSLKITSQAETHGNLAHGDESLGRSVLAKAADADRLPEVVLVACEVWRRIHSQCQLRLALDLNLENQTFGLTPIGGGLESAIDNAVDGLGEYLAENFAGPVYLGRFA